MLVKTTIKEIISNKKNIYKYFEGFSFKKEKTGTEYIITFLADDGNTYNYNFKDGRKANTFYVGKEVWGMVSLREDGYPTRLNYNWWTKEKFEQVVKTHIQRNEETIKHCTEENVRLKTF